MPKDGARRTTIPVTYVPARNTIFLSLCLGWAEAAGARDLFIGVNALDYSGYPDCRPDFVAAFEAMANLATKAGVEGERLHASTRRCSHMTKADIVREAARLGLDAGDELVLLRSDRRSGSIAACATAAGCAPGASPKRACPIRPTTRPRP